jgi:hypothetical protein
MAGTSSLMNRHFILHERTHNTRVLLTTTTLRQLIYFPTSDELTLLASDPLPTFTLPDTHLHSP